MTTTAHEAPRAEPMATTVPEPGPDMPATRPTRRRVGGLQSNDILCMVGSAVAGTCMSALLFGRLTPFSGLIGAVVVAYGCFLATYTVLVSLKDRGPVVRDKLLTALMCSSAAVVFGALVFVILYTIWRGHTALFHVNFFTQDMARAGPLQPLTVGGIKHALVGTLWMIAIALAVTVPLGITAAVYLNEIGGRFSRTVRTVVDAMTALPSIVAGLFIYATWILALHNEKSGVAAAIAISVIMLPIIIRASDVVIRLVPGNLREASAALGAPQWRTVWHVVLPTARSGLATSVILGMARGIGETAPLFLTAGFTASLNTNPIHGPMVSLPLAAFVFVQYSQKAMIARGFATAAFLMIVVLTLFVIARLIGGKGPGQLSPRQIRKSRRASSRDVARMEARAAAPRLETGASS